MAYTLLDFAKEVLEKINMPLTYQQIWERGRELLLDGRLKVSGKTPWQTLGARLYVDVRDNPGSEFVKVGKRPARFFLKKRQDQLSDFTAEKIENAEMAERKKKKSAFSERELHPLVTYFVYANPAFGRGRNIFTKTIYHEKSKKKGYSEWFYPDLAGFYLPLEDWDPNIIEFNRLTDNNVVRLYSFEVKKSVDRGNYREAYFQAVSNSSWANEGWLVAAEIKQDDELMAELERLSASFGIGIIHFDMNDFDSSRVLFPAKVRSDLDWETMNKLCEQNSGFNTFIQDVKIDYESKKIHKSEYDRVIDDPDAYIRKIRK